MANYSMDQNGHVPSIFCAPHTNDNNTPAIGSSQARTQTATYNQTSNSGGYVPSAVAMGSVSTSSTGGYVPSAAASRGTSNAYASNVYVPSSTATNGNSLSTTNSTSTNGYVPSEVAMGNLSIGGKSVNVYTPSSTGTNGYVPSAAAMGATAPSTSSTTNGYKPSAAAMAMVTSSGASSTGGYVPSAAAMGNASSGGHSKNVYKPTVNGYTPSSTGTNGYVPSAAAMAAVGRVNTVPTATSNSNGYTPSAAAMAMVNSSGANSSGYVPSTAAMGSASSYKPSTAAMGASTSATSTDGYVPSAVAMGSASTLQSSSTTNGYKPSAAAIGTSSSASSSGYVPSAAAMAGATFNGYNASVPSNNYSTPSMFASPPAPVVKPPTPCQNGAQCQKPRPTSTTQSPTQTQPHHTAPTPPQPYARPAGVLSEEERQKFEANQPEALKQADIWMISGCEDKQTSADISNVNSFQLPNPHGRAGGACTAALLSVLHENDQRHAQYTFTDVMMKMRSIIKSKRLSQIPQLSSTHPIDMNTKFEIVPEGLTGRRRAVIIGINYKGQKGELRGCHNDAFNMQKYVQGRYGFSESDTTMLIDDGRHTSPTHANILSAYRKVVAESRPGDSIFLHYSGHGTKVRDQNGDEEDGYDEAMVPLDFKRKGHILDDELYKIFVQGLPAGVHVVAVMDCCHSGTILDLPYIFKANGKFSKMEVDNSFVKRNKISSLLGNVGEALLVGALLNAIF